MKISKKKLAISFIFLFFALLFIFKNRIASAVIKARIEERGGTINIEKLNLQVFNSSFFLKGEINSLGKKVYFDNLIGHIHPLSVFQTKKHLSILELNDGGILIEDKFYFENFQNMPRIDFILFKNFLLECPIKINNTSKKTKVLIEEMNLHNWYKENNLVRFSNLHMYLIWNNIKITIESLDGQEVKFDTGEFPIELVREYLPAYISIVKQANISLHLSFKYPEKGVDGFIKGQLWNHGIKLKNKMELTLDEVLNYPMVKLFVMNIEKSDFRSEVFFSQESLANDPYSILKECNDQILKDIYLKVLR